MPSNHLSYYELFEQRLRLTEALNGSLIDQYDGTYRPGARVNLECDVIAKHVEKLLRKVEVKSGLTVDKLREQGY